MIDPEQIDALFGRIGWVLFDKRVLFSFEEIAQYHADKTDPISEDDLRLAAAQGWFPMQSGAGAATGKECCPAYVPSRVVFLRTLQRQGYGAEELRFIARHEEMLIDEILTQDDLAYLDDDVELLLAHNRGLLENLESGRLTTNDPEQPQKMMWLRGQVRLLEAYRANGVPEAKQHTLARTAFRLRAVNDAVRLEAIETDRQKIRAGYSPFILMGWSMVDGFKAGPILWKGRINATVALTDTTDFPPIRVPGFILLEEQITSVRTLRPPEYQQLWDKHDLDGYLRALSEIRGERRCLNCLVLLPAGGDDRKQFCGERCRNAAKQRRYRERNPEAVQRAQQRYWQSLQSPDS